ncbi:hypothetical protein M407DRAFT_12948, partial [Tulasnella calospora MUT 4182]
MSPAQRPSTLALSCLAPLSSPAGLTLRPPLQTFRVMAFCFITVYDRTLQRFYLLKHAIEKLIGIYLAHSAETRTATAAVLNSLWEMAEVVATLLRPTSSLEPALVSDCLLTLVKPVAIHQLEDLFSLPSLSSAWGVYPPAGTLSNETPSTSQAPSPANAITTSPPDTNGSAALPCTLPPTVLTPSHQAPSEVVFDANSDHVDQKTKDSAPPSSPSEPRHLGMTLTAPVRGKIHHACLPRISSVFFPSLPGLPDNDHRTPANVDVLLSKPNGTDLEGIVLSALASETRPHAGPVGRV